MDTDNRNASIKAFVEHWKAAEGNEKSEAQKFWMDFFNRVLGKEFVSALDFEGRIKDADKHTRFFDAYIRETKVLIEHKSRGINLDTGGKQSGKEEKETPFQQAKNYVDNQTYSDKARWIITCNFDEFRIYDLDQPDAEEKPEIILLSDLPTEWQRLQFIADPNKKLRPHEEQVTVQAGRLVGELYDALLAGYDDKDSERTLHSLNVLCVRLVFCLYAEDAGVFDPDNLYVFHDYVKSYAPEQLTEALEKLFEVLNTPVPERKVKNPALQNFPYVNGGLFAKMDIDYPSFTEDSVAILADRASAGFDWRGISPTIFGAVFESTLNPETRRQGGMHYTSIENIHKVIDPLFLDDLKAEFARLELSKEPNLTRKKKLTAFIQKLAGLKFFDPACGSGNFLTETYICLRRLENDALRLIYGLQKTMNIPIQVSIGQFYGIEINDFAVSVATTALWIAESQMFNETRDICEPDKDFLPLQNFANIKEGNALRMDWAEVVKPEEVSFIMGNPPFVGYTYQTAEQKKDVRKILASFPNTGKLDYVCCWYKKAADFIKNQECHTAFVSTNSITQGVQAVSLWPMLFDLGFEIGFAWRTFKWQSEASGMAAVHCVIIGLQNKQPDRKKIIFSENERIETNYINFYLYQTRTKCDVCDRNTPICDVPNMVYGNKPTDGGNLFLKNEEERNSFILNEPKSQKFIKQFLGATEFTNNKKRYCLWLQNISPKELSLMPHVKERVELVRAFRLKSTKPATNRDAARPHEFQEIRQPDNAYLVFPGHSSESRTYIPIGFVQSDVIVSNANFALPNATPYLFGILTSIVHNAWMRTVAGRIKSDYRYSNTLVYNNFPWPDTNESQQANISKLAQAVLDARANYPDSSLADLYNPDFFSLYADLYKAHTALDKAVLALYGLPAKASESTIVAKLFDMYAKLTNSTQEKERKP